MWPPTRLLRLSPSSCIRVTSLSLGPQPGSWVIGVSSIIDKMCKLLCMKKLWTTPYHPQMNRLVERSHQTIMKMIGKVGEDKKDDWPGHPAEIVHAYNATQSAMTGYSPHYLMFGHRPRLPVDFYFPTLRSTEVSKRGASAKHVDEYIATVQDWLRATLQEAKAQSTAGLKDKNGTTTGK